MLRRLDIVSRLLLGFGLLMLAIAGLAGLSSVSARQTGAAYDFALAPKDRRALDQVVQLRVMQARLAIWKMLAANDMSLEADAAQAFKRAHDTLERLLAETVDPGRKRAVRTMTAQLAEAAAGTAG